MRTRTRRSNPAPGRSLPRRLRRGAGLRRSPRRDRQRSRAAAPSHGDLHGEAAAAAQTDGDPQPDAPSDDDLHPANAASHHAPDRPGVLRSRARADVHGLRQRHPGNDRHPPALQRLALAGDWRARGDLRRLLLVPRRLAPRERLLRGLRGGPSSGAVLELETCNAQANQELALDGDSITAGAFPQIANAPPAPPGFVSCSLFSPPIQRQFVVAPQGNLTSAGTPLALEPRALTESEYLTFATVNGTNQAPHTGFEPVVDAISLVSALTYAGYGTVIELVTDGDDGYDITPFVSPEDGGAPRTLSIPEGVTLRGDRKFTSNGRQITYDNDDQGQVISITADDVRVTGLRFRGPSSDTGAAVTLKGIEVTDGHRVTIDHDEFSQFTKAAVEVDAYTTLATDDECPGPDIGAPPMPRATPVVVARNFVHHNEAAEQGYGLNSSTGAFPFFDGNVEYLNRHSITADNNGLTGYLAQDNFVLSDTPTYGTDDHEQDFDQHGSLDLFSSDEGITHTDHTGGVAGDYDQIEYNTFLGTNRHNYFLRGQPCRPGVMDHNVFLEGEWSISDSALEVLDISGNTTETPVNFTIDSTNAFNASDPTGFLGVGDFDGDGTDDVFVATGTDGSTPPADRPSGACSSDSRTPRAICSSRISTPTAGATSFASSGQRLTCRGAAWRAGSFSRRFRRSCRSPSRTSAPERSTRSRATTCSWPTASPGISRPPARASRRSAPPRRPTSASVTSTATASPTSSAWWETRSSSRFSLAARGDWSPLNGPTPPSIDGVVVGDFDGNRVADVGFMTPYPPGYVIYFEISFGGTSPWQAASPLPITGLAASGRFDATLPALDAGAYLVKPTVVLSWGGDLHLYGAHGTGASEVWSRQDMR